MLSASVRVHASAGMKPSFATRQNAYVIYTPKEGNQFRELPYFMICIAEFINQSGCKFSSFVAVLVDDADTPICFASKTKDFLAV